MEARGEVFDLGYQHYEGPREGRGRARKALWIDGVRTSLGIGRSAWAKIIPGLFIVALTLPAIVIGVIAVQMGLQEAGIVDHSTYLQIVLMFMLFFTAVMGPELLCPDRRDMVISLYIVRPMTMADYLTGRWLALFSLTLALVYLGQIVLFVSFALGSNDTPGYMRDNWLDVPRFLAAGLILATFTTMIALAAAALTTRRAYAAAIIIGLYIISAPIAGSLGDPATCNQEPTPGGECIPIAGSATPWIALLDLGQIPSHVNKYVFPDSGDDLPIVASAAELNPVVPVAWYVLLTVGSGALLWRRYQGLAR